MSEPSEIQKLIRLKRYERPPEDYFEDFLLEFQRRQRAEMLKRPIWAIAWERANLWLEGFRVPAIAYASALVAAAGVTGLILTSQDNPASNQVASADLAPSASISVAPIAPVAPAASGRNLPPSYVLEERPVSYDAPFSF